MSFKSHIISIILVYYVIFYIVPTNVFGKGLSVEINGISGVLLDNVRQQLRIAKVADYDHSDLNNLQFLHELAVKDIHSSLAPFGYYNSEISSQLETTGNEARALYTITLGPPVIVRKLNIEIVGEGERNKALQIRISKFPLQPGDICNQNLYDKGKGDLLSLAYAEGYLDAAFTTRSLEINRDENEAIINLVLQTGGQYYFGDTISDQKSISADLFTSLLPYKIGDPYRAEKILELQSILQRTEYFSRVKVEGLTNKADGHYVPVNVLADQRDKKNQYSFGLGFATDTGAKVRIDWRNKLFNQYGHKVTATGSIAELEKTASFTYITPLENARQDTLISNVIFQSKNWEDTDTDLFSIAMAKSGVSNDMSVDLGLALRSERYDVGITSGESILLLPTFNAGWVLADDLKNPQHGFKISLGALGSLDGVISDTDFLQFTIDGKLITSYANQWQFIARGALGTTLVDSITSIPPSLRFYTGGDSTIRGYDYKSIGSRDASGEIIGGRYLAVGSVEIDKRISERWSLAIFWDVGTATDDLDLDFYQGAGWGIRFHLPFGRVRLDLASAISEEGQPWRLHFTFGGSL